MHASDCNETDISYAYVAHIIIQTRSSISPRCALYTYSGESPTLHMLMELSVRKDASGCCRRASDSDARVTKSKEDDRTRNRVENRICIRGNTRTDDRRE